MRGKHTLLNLLQNFPVWWYKSIVCSLIFSVYYVNIMMHTLASYHGPECEYISQRRRANQHDKSQAAKIQ